MNMLSAAEIAARLRYREDSIRRMVRQGRFPRPSIGRGKKGQRWRESVVEAWIEQQQRLAAKGA